MLPESPTGVERLCVSFSYPSVFQDVRRTIQGIDVPASMVVFVPRHGFPETDAEQMSWERSRIRVGGIMHFLLNSRIVSIFLFTLVLLAVTLFVHKSFREFSDVDLSARSPVSVIAALLLICLAYANRFLFWKVLTSSFGLRASASKASHAFFLSLLGRYIPGKAGLFLFRMRAYKSGSRKMVGAALVTEYISSLLAACILVIAGTMFIPASDPMLTRWIPIGILTALLLIFNPSVLKRLINFLLKASGRASVEVFPSLKILSAVTCGYVLTGMLHGFALYTLLGVFTAVSFDMYPMITGAYYMAGLVGMFAFFAPGGLGVREGVLFLLLPIFVDAQSVVVSTVLMRLITLGSELLLASFSSALYSWRKKKGRQNEE